MSALVITRCLPTSSGSVDRHGGGVCGLYCAGNTVSVPHLLVDPDLIQRFRWKPQRLRQADGQLSYRLPTTKN